jgi:hypothetical protein
MRIASAWVKDNSGDALQKPCQGQSIITRAVRIFDRRVPEVHAKMQLIARWQSYNHMVVHADMFAETMHACCRTVMEGMRHGQIRMDDSRRIWRLFTRQPGRITDSSV